MNLIDGFLRSASVHPQRPALEVDRRCLSYADLATEAGKAACALQHRARNTHFCVGVLAHRSQNAYIAILGTLLCGKTYMPLNPKFPPARLARMIEVSGCRCLLVGSECRAALSEILAHVPTPLTVLPLDFSAAHPPGAAHHEILAPVSADDAAALAPAPADADDFAYLLFTSGSTGSPKGVGVTHRNVCAYLDYMTNWLDFAESDRFSQTFDLSFDLSVHDMFVCWKAGACLSVLPDKDVLAPAKFIKDNSLSVWFSVPSVAMFMSKMRMLKPGAFPGLRVSLFCGEALSQLLAQAWQAAAPGSAVYNIYGPTETTIAITRYRWDAQSSPAQCVNGVVPIGSIFSGHQFKIVDAALQPVACGEPGQLLLAGPQVTPGYLNDPARTKSAFLELPGDGGKIWYATGDLVKADETGCICYLGRIDDQVQILGHRAELQEIDLALRSAAGSEMAVAVAWPMENGHAEGVVGFVCGSQSDAAAIIGRCRAALPEYMVPREIYFVDELPLNSNGKVDRRALQARLKE